MTTPKNRIKLDSIVIIFGSSATEAQITYVERNLTKLLIGNPEGIPITSVFWEKGEPKEPCSGCKKPIDTGLPLKLCEKCYDIYFTEIIPQQIREKQLKGE